MIFKDETRREQREMNKVRFKRPLPDERVKEFDALMITPDCVCLNSTKATLRIADVDSFRADIAAFRTFFPKHDALPLVGILASLAVEKSMLAYAERQAFWCWRPVTSSWRSRTGPISGPSVGNNPGPAIALGVAEKLEPPRFFLSDPNYTPAQGTAMQLKVLAFVLAGGEGTRLYPLTRERAKPAVPFGGKYRIVDFVLSNLINSGIYSIYVLIQFRSQSLLQHLSDGWKLGGVLKNEFLIPVPAQMRTEGKEWYQGTADAIHQNINLIEQSRPDVVVVFGADHIYRMNIRAMIEYHEQKCAHVTIAALPMDKKFAKDFGVIEATNSGRIMGFHEKRANAPTMPGDPGQIYASMGNYVFSTDMLVKMIEEDRRNPKSSHDFGKDILPQAVGQAEMFAYNFNTNRISGEDTGKTPYWRDVGTLDAFYEANMDIRAISPELNLFNREWPLRTASYPDPPAKFAFDEEERRGQAIDSVISEGCIISGGQVRDSVLGRNIYVHAGSEISACVIFDNCDIGRNTKLRRCIVQKNARIPEGSVIGYDHEKDKRHYLVTESGIVVIDGKRTPMQLSRLTI